MGRQWSLCRLQRHRLMFLSRNRSLYNEDIVGFKVANSKRRISLYKGATLATLTVEMGLKPNMRTHKSGGEVKISKRPEQNAIFDIQRP
jgi:hypothetical protein